MIQYKDLQLREDRLYTKNYSIRTKKQQQKVHVIVV